MISQKIIVVSFSISALIVTLLCFAFQPQWNTNDDIAMSMVAHGYGLAAYGSPNLVFSNVIWGYLVRTIPEINSVLGYSIATLSMIVLVGTALIYGLLSLNVNLITTLALAVLLLTRPVLFPQFTINSGLLMVAAVICWQLYPIKQHKLPLLAGCMLAYLSYLIRSRETLLILILALPLIDWRYFFSKNTAKIAFLTLLMAIAISALIDRQHYLGSEWQAFKTFNSLRASFTDHDAGTYLKQHPDILAQHHFSPNDVDLSTAGFFIDPTIGNPITLQAMINELGPLSKQNDLITKAAEGLKKIGHPDLLPLFAVAFLLLILHPNKRLFLSWILVISAIAIISTLGRPGVLRVYIPMVSLLVIAPFFFTQDENMTRNRLASVIIIISSLFNSSTVLTKNQSASSTSERVRQNTKEFPHSPVILWGTNLLIHSYPVLKQSPSALSYQLNGLGVFNLAPYSVATAEKKLHNPIDQLMSEAGLSVITPQYRIGLLQNYCKEHFNGDLKYLSNTPFGELKLQRLKCELKE